MPRSVSRVVRRGDAFYFRMAVPDRLVERVGQRELKVSLRTSSPMDARLLGPTISNLMDVLFESLPRMPQMTPDQVRDRIRSHFLASLNKSLELAYDLPRDPEIDVEQEVAMLKQLSQELRGKLATQSFNSTVMGEAKELLASLDKPPHPADLDALRQATNGIMRAKIENARILAAMLSADFAATSPLDPMFAGIEPNGLPPIPGDISTQPEQPKTLAEIGDRYITFNVKNWAQKTAADQRRVLEIAKAMSDISNWRNGDISIWRLQSAIA